MTARQRRQRGDAERKALQMQQQLEKDKEQQVRVLDPDNKAIDRTPLPLLKSQPAKGIVKKGIVPTGVTPSQSTDRRVSTQEGGSVSQRSRSESERSISQVESSTSSDHMSTSTPDDDDTAGVMDESSDSHSTQTSALERRKSESEKPKSDESKNVPEAPSPPKEWSPEERRQWLQQEVTITLTETPTIMLFSHQDEVVSRENTQEAEKVRKQNERYEAFCAARKDGESGGRYAERGVTTLNNPMFAAHAEVHPPQSKPAGGIQVTTWRLYDEMLKANEEDEEGAPGAQGDGEGEPPQEDATDSVAAEDDVGQDDVGDDNQPSPGGSKKTNAWMSSPNLLQTLLFVERSIMMNNYEDLQLAYRGIQMEPLKDHLQKDKDEPFTPNTKTKREYGATYGTLETEKTHEEKETKEAAPAMLSKPKLRILWRYGCETTKGKNTSCMSWNRKNPDILAAGYGEYGIPGVQGTVSAYSGIVCCWNLKNPVAPERVIHIESDAGVSAMHFSAKHPSLLAVGNTDGTLALYDVRKHGNSPALKTTVSTGQHTGTIWELKWVERGKDRGESLVSISADGHVMEWTIKKGLERTADLMKLKRIPNRNNEGTMYSNKGAGKEAMLSRQSGGMCFDINPKEPITYVVGTEDGTIHKCSKSQNENYILDYKPHEEPVYRVRWSPFCPDYFLSCSADWTSRLYHLDRVDPVIRFDSNKQDAVHDVCWSYTNSTVFGAATAQGHVDIWDISDPLQPKSSLLLEQRSLNCILFAEQESPLLTVGDSSGDVTVIKLTGSEFERREMTTQEQEEHFEEVVHKMGA